MLSDPRTSGSTPPRRPAAPGGRGARTPTRALGARRRDRGARGRPRALEAAGRHVVHLEVGRARRAHAAARGRGRGARPARRAHALRAAGRHPRAARGVAESLRARGVPADPARVVVSPGAKAMIFTTLLAAVRPATRCSSPTRATRPTRA
jgi:aspartate/methionine/tyrosine aminotransferase